MYKETFECECLSDEHTLRFWVDDEPGDGHVYVVSYLRKYPFWKRLVLGLKYIFGGNAKYGHFEDFIMRFEDLERLGKIIEDAKKFVK